MSPIETVRSYLRDNDIEFEEQGDSISFALPGEK